MKSLYMLVFPAICLCKIVLKSEIDAETRLEIAL